MKEQRLFTEADLACIREATRRAEARTAGEIVPYLVRQVDEYHEAPWRGAVLGALTGALVAGLLEGLAVHWAGVAGLGAGLLHVTLPALAGAASGYMLGSIRPLGRYLITASDVARRVQLRAEAAFLEEGVFRTRDRTGILIFLALFERQAVILADEGIHRAVPPETWPQVVDSLVAGIRAGRSTEALCQAIERCGEILEHHHVERRADDRDELEDGLRIRDR